MVNLLQSFAMKHFSGLLAQMNPEFQSQFITMLMVVVHSHRHNKDEAFLAEFDLDFSIVRDTMYKYSKKSQERFFSFPIFSFLLLWFASSQEGLEFLREKYSKKGIEYI